MLDVYIKLKESYPKSIILIKSGSFYECLCDDAIIMNELFGYKIKELKKYIRVGFPISNLIKVTSILTKYEINYITVDKTIKNNERFSRNQYNNYINDIKRSKSTYNLALKKIKSINNDLNNNINNPKIIDILNEIERGICKLSL